MIELVDELFSQAKNAAGLGINWQCFGSNGQETADYSRGVLERFTRRANDDWKDSSGIGGNLYRKTIENPRLIKYRINPHFSLYFLGKAAINPNGEYLTWAYYSKPILTDKIVINHYYTKSREEYEKKKLPRGSCCMDVDYKSIFDNFDRNEVFDDGILKYRDTCEKNFSFENDFDRIQRVEKALFETLTQAPLSAPPKFFNDKLETFLTCRAVAEKLGTRIADLSAEEFALAWIYTTWTKSDVISFAEAQQLLRALPEILERPFPICKRIKELAQNEILPFLCESLKSGNVISGFEDWMLRADLIYIQKLLRLIK